MNGIAACRGIFNASGIYEVVVRAARQKRIGKLAEELFEESSDTVYIVVERCGITEINDLGVCGNVR